MPVLNQQTRQKGSVKLRTAERTSRIRRDPPPAPARKALRVRSDNDEAWPVVIGVILFALAIAIIIVAVSDYTK